MWKLQCQWWEISSKLSYKNLRIFPGLDSYSNLHRGATSPGLLSSQDDPGHSLPGSSREDPPPHGEILFLLRWTGILNVWRWWTLRTPTQPVENLDFSMNIFILDYNHNANLVYKVWTWYERWCEEFLYILQERCRASWHNWTKIVTGDI